jgi:hypothetical protein
VGRRKEDRDCFDNPASGSKSYFIAARPMMMGMYELTWLRGKPMCRGKGIYFRCLMKGNGEDDQRKLEGASPAEGIGCRDDSSTSKRSSGK